MYEERRAFRNHLEYGEGYAVKEGWACNGGRLRQEYRIVSYQSPELLIHATSGDLDLPVVGRRLRVEKSWHSCPC